MNIIIRKKERKKERKKRVSGEREKKLVVFIYYL
jgi:hypothetical protein